MANHRADEGRGSNAGGRDTHTTERVAAAAHGTVDRLAEKASHVERELKSTARAASAKAHDAREELERESKRVLGKIERMMHEQPVTCAALAFAAGVITVSLLRRR
jgi:hypothetical protein